ncbi:YafY family protein [Shouchella sp. 1P09AA]|uniref:helix-turn-helix transcriptional regulator n=1 Tax=unclassified Shouchella TaxID=2893065 RepID=UPI0039A31253
MKKKGEGMSKSARLIEMMLYINERTKFTATELSDHFQVSYRTILRDLEELSTLGVPFYSEVGHGGGYYRISEQMLPPLFLKETEAVALYFSFQSLAYFPTLPFKTETDYALKKLKQHFSKEARETIEKMSGRIVFWSPSRHHQANYLEELLHASTNRVPIRITYQKEDTQMEREIQPIGLYSSYGFWYCPAYCFERKTIRLFRADRITAVKKGQEKAVALPYESVLDWLHQAEEECEHPLSFIVDLTRTGVRKAQSMMDLERFIHVGANGEAQLQATVPLKEVRYFTEMIWNLGSEATIKEPQEAIDFIQEKLQKIWSNYQ